MSLDSKEKVEIEKGLLVRTYAAICTGSFVPSMFEEVRDIMIQLDSAFGAQDENKSSD